MQTGVLGTMDLAKSAYAGFKLYEVVPYLIETTHIWASGVVYFSAPFWESLKGDEQAVFAAAAAEGARYFNQFIVEDETVFDQGCVCRRQDGAAGRSASLGGARGVWAALGPKVSGVDQIEAIAKSA